MNTVEPIRDKETVIDIAEYLKKDSERNYVMFLFGIYSGLRISDILKFRVRDVKDKSDIVLREKKTGKEKRFPINRDLKKALEQYIVGKDDYEFLFKNPHENKPITRQQAYNILSDAGKKFGIEKIGTHTLRKTFCLLYTSDKEKIPPPVSDDEMKQLSPPDDNGLPFN